MATEASWDNGVPGPDEPDRKAQWACHPRNWTYHELRNAFAAFAVLVLLVVAMLT